MAKWVEVRGFDKSLKSFKVCVQAQDKHIVLIKQDDQTYYAIDNECPHAGLPLEEGDVRGSIITCRFHGYTYNLKDGKNVDCPTQETPAKIFPVKLEDQKVYVQLDD